MSESSLKNKAVTGLMWTTIQRFSGLFVGFVSSIILARLLTPDDYGCIGMLAIFMVISNAFIEGGFNSALVQKKRPTHEDYTVVFYWNITISVLCYLLLFFAAPYIARFYHVPLLCSVLRVQGIVLIVNALKTVHVSQMYKNFRFRKLAIVSIVTSLISLPVTIWMAYRGYGVWSLVAQGILGAAVPALIYWFTDHWWPLPYFSVKAFKELFKFGSYILLSSLVSQIIDNIQGLFIGRLYNPARMGYYSKADSTRRLASQTLNEVVSQVTFPLFSEIQDQRERLIDVIRRLNSASSYVVFPMLFIFILLAKPLFIILYSERWLESVPYFQILCLASMTICINSSLGQALKAIGLSKELFYWGIICSIGGVIIIVTGLFVFGLDGMLWGMVLKSFLALFINARLVSKNIGYTMRKQFLDLLPIMLITIIASVSSYVVGMVLSFNIYVVACIEMLAFFVIYWGGSSLFKVEAKDILLDLLRPFIKKILHR